MGCFYGWLLCFGRERLLTGREILRAMALAGGIIGGCILILQGKGEAGTALIIIVIEEAWRNGKKGKD